MENSVENGKTVPGAGAVAEAECPPPIFILAAPRSFSSLVCTVLGQHPELYGVPELNLFQCANMDEFITGKNPDGSLKSPFWNTMRHGLLRTVAELYGGEQTVESVSMAERWIRARLDNSATDVARELCARIAPRRMVEKSPAYLRKRENLERMLSGFPNAKFINLVRHPRGQCESLIKAKGGIGVLMTLNSIDYTGEEPALEPQILWHDAQIQVLNFLEDLPQEQWRTLRGEDFLGDLDTSLKDLCQWLGVSTSADAIARMKKPEESPFACLGPANARLGNDINFLRSPNLRDGKIKTPSLEGPVSWRENGNGFYDEVVELARELGYS